MCVNCPTRLTCADHTNQADNCCFIVFFVERESLRENPDKAESVAPDWPVQSAQPNLGQP